MHAMFTTKYTLPAENRQTCLFFICIPRIHAGQAVSSHGPFFISVTFNY
jgi:hypothetical protein